jgi:hypothetical protein
MWEFTGCLAKGDGKGGSRKEHRAPVIEVVGYGANVETRNS